MSRILLPLCGALLTLLAIGPAAGAQANGERRVADARIDGRYVVAFVPGVTGVDRAIRARERRDGFRARHRYRAAIKGFSARLSRSQVRTLRADARVATVMPDRRVHALATEPLAAGEIAPTGVDRIEAVNGGNTAGPASVAVAIIDTGIDSDHPDLAGSVRGGVNCVGGASYEDDEGHGTHVAATVGGRNDGGGVVGVAPGTGLYSVKVLDRNGSGSTSSVICGIDWVTANAASIGVANMSLGGGGEPIEPCSPGMDDLEHLAICRSTAAGVLYAVAAGNNGWDFDYAPVPDVPAAYPEVVTVTAAADTDGAPGGLGERCGHRRRGDADDSAAGFSNYAATAAGRAHTVAAPGACILSARLDGGTTTHSGTSMASPHAAGALALCLTSGACAGGEAPASLIASIADSADAAYGFSGDPFNGSASRYYGHLLRLSVPPLDGGGGGGGGGEDPPPDPGGDIALDASGYKVKGRQHVDLSWSGATGGEVDIERDGSTIATTANDGAYTDPIGARGGATYTYRVCEAGTSTCSAEVSVSF